VLEAIQAIVMTQGVSLKHPDSASSVAVFPPDWQNLDVILVFCAFGAEFGPLRARMRPATSLRIDGLVGSRGRIGKYEVTLVKTGIGVRRARESAERALDSIRDVELVAIAGVAGALHRDLRVGNVLLADRLMMRRAESFHAEGIVDVPREPFETFSVALESAAIAFTAGALLTSHRAIPSVMDKRLAAEQSGAIAVDMESAVIAAEVHRRGQPFVCLRTILDEVDHELVGATLADENGRVRPLSAAKAIITNPAILVGATRLMRNLRTSTRILASVMESTLQRLE
jgi:adenosylhomocysteine nucleosidase